MKNSPNRVLGPRIQDIRKVKLPEVNYHLLDNKIPVYTISSGTQEVVKMEAIFQGGRLFEKKEICASACVHMLKEGTNSKNSASISSFIDYHGGSLSVRSGMDSSSITLFCMKKYFNKLLPLFTELIIDSVFPEDEIAQYANNSKRRLSIELSKNDVQAYRILTEKIFGPEHPYGYNSQPANYDVLTRDDLMSHYNNCYGHQTCQLILSGKIDDGMQSSINKHLGQVQRQTNILENHHSISDVLPEKVNLTTRNNFQSSIRIGRKLFNRKHPDYAKTFVMTALLGGYFGSRLMKNIREDKGYTYNIYSGLDAMRNGGYFYLCTDVGNEFVKETLRETYLEITKLRNEKVNPKEIKVLKNYLLGNSLSILDGPLNASRVLKSLLINDLEISYFDDFIDKVSKVQPIDVQEMANKYLMEDELWQVVVGNP